MSIAGSDQPQPAVGGHEMIVAADGSIPATELAKLGVRPGQHLRIVVDASLPKALALRGSLAEYPEPSWEDFEYAGTRAREDFGLL